WRRWCGTASRYCPGRPGWTRPLRIRPTWPSPLARGRWGLQCPEDHIALFLAWGLLPLGWVRSLNACLIANAAASVRLVERVLLRMLRTWLATVLRLTNSSSAIWRLLLPAATKLKTWASRSLKPAG